MNYGLVSKSGFFSVLYMRFPYGSLLDIIHYSPDGSD